MVQMYLGEMMKETDMLNAWLWKKHRHDLQWRRVRLGVLPTKEWARMYMTILRWTDAIVVKDGVIRIVESKLRADPGALGQLELYKKLFYNTPEFSAYKEWDVELVLLTAVLDVNMVELCSEKNITYALFTEEQVNKVRIEMMLPTV